MSVTGAARGTSQRRLFYRCGASIYRGRGRLGAVRSVCRTAGLGVGGAMVCSHPGRVLLQGGGDAFDCRSTASVRSEGKPIHRARPFAPGGGALPGWGVARSMVGAPPRCEAKSNQYTEPVRSRPGRVLLQGGGDAFDCRSTASVRTESNQYTEPAHSHPGRVLLQVLRGNEKAPASFDARAFDMAQRTGLEPATPGVTGRYSNRLNYRCASV